MEVSGSGAKKLCSKEKLPHNLVMEILSWLHVKHLWPLRCVSKAWLHSLTKHPYFAKLQFDRFIEINKKHPDPIIIGSPPSIESKDKSLNITTDFLSCEKAFTVDFPFYKPNKSYKVCGMSNGLLCIYLFYHKTEIYIWNPIINDHITVSCLPAPSVRFPGYTTYTGFSFGFDQVSNVYKVIRLFDEIDFGGNRGKIHDSRTQISVYTLGVDSMWRTVQVDIPHSLARTYRSIPLVNGALHWHSKKPGTTSWDLIVAFDLKEEVISEFMLPHCIKFYVIGELSGLLCAIHRTEDEQETHIWIMKEHGVVSSWSKQYIIRKPEGCLYIYRLSPLGITHNGGIILVRNYEDLVLYNPETKTVNHPKKFQFAPFSMYAFLGSIISPTAISQAGHALLEEESRRS